MGKIITLPLAENFIKRLADFLEKSEPTRDFGRTVIVFGGKRPALYLKRELAQRFRKAFFPPVFFTVDEFMEHLVRRRENFQRISETEACYLIYNLHQKLQATLSAVAGMPSSGEAARSRGVRIAKEGEFSRFLPWAREIYAFIEQLDIEDIPSERLENVEKSADIGFDIPESINDQLKTIIALRESYHRALEAGKQYSRGFIYRLAARYISEINPGEFDRIVFAGLFYLTRTEEQVIKYLHDTDKATIIFQGNPPEWSILERAARAFSCPIIPTQEKQSEYNIKPPLTLPSPLRGEDRSGFASSECAEVKGDAQASKGEGDKKGNSYNVKLYAGFDAHSQACLVREILETIAPERREKTVIVVPEPASLLPLLSEIAGRAGEFNVSMGYPLKRSSIHSLFRAIFRAQETRHGNYYYTRDYLRVLSHPFIKNLKLESEPSVTRVLVHRLEEFLLGIVENPLGGTLFIGLREIESLEQIYVSTNEILDRMGLIVDVAGLKKILRELHQFLFGDWEEKKLNTFGVFSRTLEKFVDLLLQKSFLARYPLNLEFIQAVLAVKKEMETASFRDEKFPAAEIFRIFEDKLNNEMINFSGSPLKGLQVLGLFETRGLAFEEVIVIDANESILPRLRLSEPLIPRDIMINIGLERYGLEEEIQRHQFHALLAPAQNVYLVYDGNLKKEKSRYLEELNWKKQQEAGSLEEPPLRKAFFNVQAAPAKSIISKNPDMVTFLGEFRYSASSVDTYLRCPLMFYYRYVLGLREKEELLEEPEGKEIGTFIHLLLEEAYRGFLGKEPIIDENFRIFFLNMTEKMFETGFQKTIKAGDFLVRQLLRQRLEKFLDYEWKNRKVKEIVSLEQSLEGEVESSGRVFKFGYKIDRIDRLPGGKLLVIDYKTGAEQKVPAVKKLESMELTRESIRGAINSFQLPLYIDFIGKKYKESGTTAALYYLRKISLVEFPGEEYLPQRELIMEKCLQALRYILSEIINPEVGFSPDEGSCRNCQFGDICR
ncbi:MAG: PD-(D/E)XK nuclease family protein [Candidatus Omnitrophica bacterium]|nr:PD-(D/E)XK nuclease family protein [Candidatus Omnitrophota bacterium]